ncbi:hypothetical protein [Streptomyces xinghaiensis]|uniref:hypothetical protein n=1 Tax=Streptomyces xinghaiensis TaxID=1038928 RepID=UPI001EDF899E|nr:hypothetical protein [Streptomyces xinghaiensis]
MISAAVLLVGGITAGLLSNRSTDGARGGTADAAPDEKPPASHHAPPPDSPTHIDAALPTPDSLDRDGLDRAPDKYWLFSSDHYIRVRLSTEQHSTNPVHDQLTPVSPIVRWTGTLNKFPEFRSGIDAALHVPGHQNEYWVFSRDKYMRIRIADTPPYYEDTLLDGPKPISDDWKNIFRGLRLHDIDALMPVPDDPEQVWVFAGEKYARVKIGVETSSRKPNGRVKTGPMNIGEGWKSTFGSTPGFKNGIDEVVPVPGDPNKYWVFSGAQYMKINVTDTEYMDTVDQAPRKLSL